MPNKRQADIYCANDRMCCDKDDQGKCQSGEPCPDKTKTTPNTRKIVAFRIELIKIMPGYKWTVHDPSMWTQPSTLRATGIQSSGSNRTSTLEVTRNEDKGTVWYESQSSGYGVHSKPLTDQPMRGATLAQSLRSLQEFYQYRATIYTGAQISLQDGRKKTTEGLGTVAATGSLLPVYPPKVAKALQKASEL